jgi:hypothetical protein
MKFVQQTEKMNVKPVVGVDLEMAIVQQFITNSKKNTIQVF